MHVGFYLGIEVNKVDDSIDICDDQQAQPVNQKPSSGDGIRNRTAVAQSVNLNKILPTRAMSYCFAALLFMVLAVLSMDGSADGGGSGVMLAAGAPFGSTGATKLLASDAGALVTVVTKMETILAVWS